MELVIDLRDPRIADTPAVMRLAFGIGRHDQRNGHAPGRVVIGALPGIALPRDAACAVRVFHSMARAAGTELKTTAAAASTLSICKRRIMGRSFFGRFSRRIFASNLGDGTESVPYRLRVSKPIRGLREANKFWAWPDSRIDRAPTRRRRE